MRRQSTRRMLVAQKRRQEYKDVLRRRKICRKQERWFYQWWLRTSDVTPELWHIEKLRWRVKLIGNLPGQRRLVQGMPIDITWDGGEWLVSEIFYHMHTVAPTIHKALTRFRQLLCDYLDGLSEREDRLSQDLRDQLAYLRELIEEQQYNGTR